MIQSLVLRGPPWLKQPVTPSRSERPPRDHQGFVWTPDDHAVAADNSIDAARWRAMFDQAMARIAGRFKRVEPRATALAFVLALLSGVEQKNCWRLAEQAGHARPGTIQRLLRSSRWDADAVRDDIRAYVLELVVVAWPTRTWESPSREPRSPVPGWSRPPRSSSPASGPHLRDADGKGSPQHVAIIRRGGKDWPAQ